MESTDTGLEAKRSLSPIIPKGNEATEPMETAAAPSGEVKMEPSDGESEVKAADSAGGNGDDEGKAVVAGGLLTEAMVAEEEKLHEQTMKEETKMRQEGEKQISDLEQELREQRFRRLEFVLKKSNLYTSYLCERMEKQKAEAEAACERREARLKRKIEKVKEREQTSAGTVTRGTRSGNNKENSLQTSQDVETKKQPPAADLKSPPRTRKSLRGAQSGNSSPASTASSQSPGNPTRRGRKRKAENVENYNIADYFSKALENTKKRKVDENDANKRSETVSSGKEKSETTKTEQENIKTNINESLPVSNIDDILNSQEQEDEDGAALPVRYIDGEQVSPDQPELFTGGVLREYQLEGFQWLRVIYENGINGILADEMGLGKTVQCIATIAHLMRNGISGPFLVCAPLSTVPNWVSEFERFAPKLPVILYHGNKDQRAQLRKKIGKRNMLVDDVYSQPVVVTSYEIVMNDRKFMQNYEWKYIIVDEGHRIKNFQCRLIRELKLYKSTHRLLLTGTPLQNNLCELWSLLNFLLPEIFDDLTSFETWFDIETLQSNDCHAAIIAEEQRQSVLGMLHQILTPFMLRRLKSDVELAVPPKREVLVYAPLTSVQEGFYMAAVNKTLEGMVNDRKKKAMEEQLAPVELNSQGRAKRRASCKKVNYAMMLESSEEKEARENNEGDSGEDIDEWANDVMKFQQEREQAKSVVQPMHTGSVLHIKLQNILMLLRRTCNHPYLLEYPLTPAGEFKIDEELINSCGKLLLLDRMLPELKRRGHKVLIFSQMTSMMDILEDYCYLRKFKYCRLDGNMGFEERRDQMAQFNKDEETFLFLLSTRAGGLGINLVAADTVIIYDSDWNPQSDLQAQDRAHRIGQTRPVMVYRLVTANTVDSKIVERASAKRKLEKIVIHKGKFKEGLKSFTTEFKALDPQELLELLKANDFDSVVRGRDGHVISNRELNKLLDRSDLYKIWETQKNLKKGIKPTSRSSLPTHMEDVEGVFKVISEDQGGFNVNNDSKDSAVSAEAEEKTIGKCETDTDAAKPAENGEKEGEKDALPVDKEQDTSEENNNKTKSKTVNQPPTKSLEAES